MRPVNLIVVHCSASPDGQTLARFSPGGGAVYTSAQVIDDWHLARGFRRDEGARLAFNPQLAAIGYHFVVDVDGSVATGRALEEVGAHVYGYNAESIGICLVGTARFTRAQWTTLEGLVAGFESPYDVTVPLARRFGIPLAAPQRVWNRGYLHVRNGICGHRDLSPDQDRNGIVEVFEWLKTCPGFDVAAWIAGGFRPLAGHVFEPLRAESDSAPEAAHA